MDLSSLTVNCSILWPGRSVVEVLDHARAAGADAVEFWWPFSSADPAVAEVDEFLAAVEDSGLSLVAMNLYAGDLAGGDRGVLSWPGRESEIRKSVAVANRVQEATGCHIFNALYGRRQDNVSPEVQDAVALDNLGYATGLLGDSGGTVVLEAVSGFADYPLKHAADVVGRLEAADSRGIGAVGMLLDVFHLAINGDDVSSAISRYSQRIAHVQIADAPGRGMPGSGSLPIARWLDELAQHGYRGSVALEFQSSADDPFVLDGKEKA